MISRGRSRSGRESAVTEPRGIESELEPGERLLWSGRPQGGRLLRRRDAVAVPFVLLWCVGAFLMAWDPDRGAPDPLAAFFVAGGLYLLFGRFVLDAHRRARTAYALTNRRVVIVSEARGRHVVSVPLATLQHVGLAELRHGRGDIVLGPGEPEGFWGGGRSRAERPTLEAIEGARHVYELLRRAQHEGSASRA